MVWQFSFLFLIIVVINMINKDDDFISDFDSDLSMVISMPEEYIPIFDNSNPFGIQTKLLNSNNQQFIHNNVSLSLVGDFLQSDIELVVKPMKMQSDWENVNSNVFDFSIAGTDLDPGIIEIRIPYEDSYSETLAGAAYYNEKTKEWEPVSFTIDNRNNQVVILTDHLSVYGSFWIDGKKSRGAKISEIFSYVPSKSNNKIYDEIISEALNNQMKPGQKALDLGLNITNEWLGFSGSGLTIQNMAYSTDFLSGLSNAMTNVGGALALMQVAIDYSNGDYLASTSNAMKNSVNFAVSKFGTSALQVSFVGVFFIDYSLSKFAKTAIDGREKDVRRRL